MIMILIVKVGVCNQKDSSGKHVRVKMPPPPAYIILAKLGYAGVYLIFLIFARKHILWVHAG